MSFLPDGESEETREKRREWFASLGLPRVCGECQQDWQLYNKQVETEVDDSTEFVVERPIFEIRELICPQGHRHQWVDYAYEGAPPVPDAVAKQVLQRYNAEREANKTYEIKRGQYE